MIFLFKKVLFNIIFNSSLFLILIIGIQNSNYKKKVNLVLFETVKLPISFIVGVGYISGSLTGSLSSLIIRNQRS